MSDRELVVLGTASQAPTRRRNQGGALLRWNGDSILFDPGEGAQRQSALAGASLANVHRICISHFHGDHCLGLPGVIMRMAVDQGSLPVPVHFPASGRGFFEHLRQASVDQEYIPTDALPISEPGVIHETEDYILRCARLDHTVETYGFRLEERDAPRFVRERLDAAGIVGEHVGELERRGAIEVAGRRVTIDEVTEIRRGQVFAYVMDTGWCDGALELADGADLLMCESTFLSRDAALAAEYLHLTAQQAGRLAREAGARRLVLSHFSRRYDDPERVGRGRSVRREPFAAEARREFDDVVEATDLQRIPVPARA